MGSPDNSDAFMQPARRSLGEGGSCRDAIQEVRPPATEAQRECLGALVRREARRLRRAWILPAPDLLALRLNLQPRFENTYRGRWAEWFARRRLRRQALVALEVLAAADLDRAEAGRAISILSEDGAAGLLTG